MFGQPKDTGNDIAHKERTETVDQFQGFLLISHWMASFI